MGTHLVVLASIVLGLLALHPVLAAGHARKAPAATGLLTGTIWDRHGEVLADTVRDAESRRRRRDYPFREATIPFLGALDGDAGVEQAYRQELAHGLGLTLTISARLQGTAVEALGTRRGAAVLVAVPSGEILALGSAPAAGNLALTGLYPLGPLLDAIARAAALETGTATEATPDAAATGTPLRAVAERLGFNAPLFVLPAGRGSQRAVATPTFLETNGDGDVTRATPLQLALVAAIVASDGRRPRLSLIRAVGTKPFTDDPVARRWPRALRRHTARAITRMMVAEMTGEAGRDLPHVFHVNDEVHFNEPLPPRADVVTVAGTIARVPGHAWFVGFLPAGRPEVAVAVVTDHDGRGLGAAPWIGLRLLADGLDELYNGLEHRPIRPPARAG